MERFTIRAFNPQPEPPAMGLLLPAVQAAYEYELKNVLVSSYNVGGSGA